MLDEASGAVQEMDEMGRLYREASTEGMPESVRRRILKVPSKRRRRIAMVATALAASLMMALMLRSWDFDTTPAPELPVVQNWTSEWEGMDLVDTELAIVSLELERLESSTIWNREDL